MKDAAMNGRKAPSNDPPKRKLIEFEDDVFAALDRLAKDNMMTVQELADEAFSDVLKKHGRPVLLEDQLKQSLRLSPANDREPRRPARRK
jgi:hypothetical protein